MSAVLVDSNVLLDLLTRNSEWWDWSSHTLAQLGNRSRLVINPIIYAGVSVRFSRIEDCDAAFPITMVHRETIPYAAAFLAGKAFAQYRRRGGARRSPLPDFFIGAHAAAAGHQLLTRDASRYATYFPHVSLIAPG